MASGERILLDLLLVVLAAKLGGGLAQWLRQPAVLGELLAGFFLGPSLLGWLPSLSTSMMPATSSAAMGIGTRAEILLFLAELGVLLLLFQVGLESDLHRLRRAGPSATLVGVLGVVFSLAFGFLASQALDAWLPWTATMTAMARPRLLHAFIGAVLAATSVGITARVLSDLGRLRTHEAHVILGAAVIDDVLGLIVLGLIGSILTIGRLEIVPVARVAATAILFFATALLVARLLGPPLLGFFHRRVRVPFLCVAFALILLLAFAYLASLAGLAPILGAFAAGLGLAASPHRQAIYDEVRPLENILAGVFFVVLGARVEIQQGVPWKPFAVAVLVLTIVAALAKLLAGLGVLGHAADRLVVGIGMVPRGEVGLIFAAYGLDHWLLAAWQYTALLLVVFLTTLLAPPLLRSVDARFRPATDDTSRGPDRLAQTGSA